MKLRQNFGRNFSKFSIIKLKISNFLTLDPILLSSVKIEIMHFIENFD